MTDSEFYEDMLRYHAEQGRMDADGGFFRLPYDDGSDPEEQDANHAYREAWWKHRKLLGEKFVWSDW